MNIVETRVLDDATEYSEFDRGKHFLDQIRTIGVNVRGKDVADLGTGFGSIALASARAGANQVIALDAHPDRVAEVAKRAAAEGLDVNTYVSNLLLPIEYDMDVDIAFLIGVVEYAGLWDLSRPVEELQAQVFKNAFRVLRPGGTLVLATKNRLWPPYAVKDIHTNQPLVNALPRRSADWLSNRLSGTKYREHLHTPSRWERLVADAGFKTVVCYYPFFNYQYPLSISQRPSISTYRSLNFESVPRSLHSNAIGTMPMAKAALMSLTAKLGITVSQSILIVATR